MPERAEIATMSDQLKERILNQECSYMIMLPKSRYWKEDLYSSCPMPYQDNGTSRLYSISSRVVDVTSRGKKIIISFKTPIDTDFKIVSSCGMDGRWSWEQSKYTCLIFIFPSFCAYYEDVTNKGLFSICLYPSPEYDHIFKDVGPDLMTEEVTYEVYIRIITNPRIKHLKIMNFMMEQKYMSGIGNYLRAEILYTCRISPHRTLESLSDTDRYYLFYYSKTIIWATYKANGLTIQDYLDPSGKTGKYECVCYGRTHDPNGYEIITEKDGRDGEKGRTIHWCPKWQI